MALPPIKLPNQPRKGEFVIYDVVPEQLSFQLSWMGQTVKSVDTPYWKSMGVYSWGNVINDLYVNKRGDKMSGQLVNLDVTYDNATDTIPDSPPFSPVQIDPKPEYIVLEPFTIVGGIQKPGAFGIESNQKLIEPNLPLEIRNDGIIQGNPIVGEKLTVKLLPYSEYGPPGQPITYSYSWKSIDGPDEYDNPLNQPEDGVQECAVYSAGKGYFTGRITDTENFVGNGIGAEIDIDEVDEDGRVIAVSSTIMRGIDYKNGDIFKIDQSGNTSAYVIVTETYPIKFNEIEPDKNDPAWSSAVEIGTDEDYEMQASDIGKMIRCDITVTRGAQNAVSHTNSIGMVS